MFSGGKIFKHVISVVSYAESFKNWPPWEIFLSIVVEFQWWSKYLIMVWFCFLWIMLCIFSLFQQYFFIQQIPLSLNCWIQIYNVCSLCLYGGCVCLAHSHTYFWSCWLHTRTEPRAGSYIQEHTYKNLMLALKHVIVYVQ